MTPPPGAVRIGAVNYLNTKPLTHRLDELLPAAEIVLDLPSRLADDLAAGRLDVALIPSIEYLGDPGYRIVSDACIACRGPVLSVKMFSRVPADRIRTLALDEGSRTSAALVQILLHARYAIRPRITALPIGASVDQTSADAVLLIGDRAIHAPEGPFAEVWDLGDQWCRWAEIPFVFAMWVAREGVELADVEAALCAARDSGVAHIEEIARREAAALSMTQRECVAYLRDNLHFRLGDAERQGLEKFFRLAGELGLTTAGAEFGLFDCKSAG